MKSKMVDHPTLKDLGTKTGKEAKHLRWISNQEVLIIQVKTWFKLYRKKIERIRHPSYQWKIPEDKRIKGFQSLMKLNKNPSQRSSKL